MNHAPYKPFSINVKTYLVVTFDPNGSGATVSPTTKNAFPGEIYGDLPTPIREGYAFTGWYTESTGGTLVSADTIVSSNTSHKLYAHWDLAGYDVIIHSQTETGNIKLNGTVINFGSETSKTFRLTATSFTLEYIQTDLDYSFDKWHVTFPDDFGPDVYEEYTSNPATIPLETTTEVYVILKNSTYVVTFDAETNGGTLVGNRQITVTAGQTYGDGGEFPTATKEGYTFSGWFTQASGGTRITESTRVALTKDQTLYAQFGECTITLNRPTNGSMYYNGTLVVFTSSTVSYKIPEGQRTVLKAVPDEGYVFDRWTFVLLESGIEDYSLAAETTEYIYEDWDINVDFKIDEDDPDEKEEEDLPHGIPLVIDRCYLAFHPDSESTTPTALLNLPNIQSIEMQDNATITEISTIIYGFNDNFVMDTGTVRKYTVTCRRVQPVSVNDNVDFSYQDRWSNGFWFTQLKRFLARWQNLNYGVMNNKVARTGGYRFHFEPGSEDYRSGVSYSDLYPTVDYNVFVLGAISSRYSGNNLQYLEVSIPLTVGSMIREVQEAPGSTIRLSPGSLSGLSTITMKVPTEILYPAPNTPKQWLYNTAVTGLSRLSYWNSGIYPGQLTTASSLEANWDAPTYVRAFSSSGSIVLFSPNIEGSGETIEDSIGGATKVKIWAISGGGGGASGHGFGKISSGGGGGSGAYYIGVLGFSSTYQSGRLRMISVEIGQGGSGADGVSEVDGDDGGDTLVNLVYYVPKESDNEEEEGPTYEDQSVNLLSLRGGSGGTMPTGISGYGTGRGGAGSADGESEAGRDSKGATGGGGGGIPSLSTAVPIGTFNGVRYTIPQSKGGRGWEGREGGDGVCGGGGGGGGYTYDLISLIRGGGDGGDGYVVLAFYR